MQLLLWKLSFIVITSKKVFTAVYNAERGTARVYLFGLNELHECKLRQQGKGKNLRNVYKMAARAAGNFPIRWL